MRFASGQSGNPSGRKPGSKTRRAQIIEQLFAGEIEEVARKTVALALDGNVDCIKIVLDRITPARRDPLVRFPLQRVDGPPDPALMAEAVLYAVSRGHLTPAEAGALGSLLHFRTQPSSAWSDDGDYELNVTMRVPTPPGMAAFRAAQAAEAIAPAEGDQRE